MVICLERGADLHMAQLMPLPLTVSCFSKIEIGLPFLVPAHPGSSGKRAIKRVCVCVCVCTACIWPCLAPTSSLFYTVSQKKGTDFLLCASLLILDRNWRIFFPCIKEHVSYNSVYLILTCVKNFA